MLDTIGGLSTSLDGIFMLAVEGGITIDFRHLGV